MIGISACLGGIHCTYKGSHHLINGLEKMYEEGLIVMVCPEVLGGLPIPREPSEIQSLEPLFIKNNKQQDVTKEYIIGAQKALEIFLQHHVDVAILKLRSPSCSCKGIYDGTFTHTLIEGQGVFAKMCEESGIKVFHENQIEEFLKYIGKEEKYGTYFKDSTSI